MKITGLGPKGISEYLKLDKEKRVKAPPSPKGAPEGEKVRLSDDARNIQKLKEILKGVDDIRPEVVERLKRTIEEGSYSVEGKKVAEKLLIESLIELIK